ncbi:10447_t:CDS:1, partial [Acaulospora morrowiae]
MFKIAIPKLWSNPLFKTKRRDLLIRTYLSCLNEEEKANLIPFDINISDINQRPLLQYEEYMESCNNYLLEVGARDWLRLTTARNVDQKDLRIKQISRVLWTMFLSRSHNLKSFFYNVSKKSSVESIFPEASMILNARHSLSNLQFLFLLTDDKLNGFREIRGPLNFLKSIPSVCSNIRDIRIYDLGSGVDNELFCDIIKSQRSIRSFGYMGNINRVITSLKAHRNSLTKLLYFFSPAVSSLEALTCFECLESLNISNCTFTVNGNRILSSNFRNIKE